MSTADAPLPTAPVVQGDPPRLLIVRAPYYREVIDGMSWGATRILDEAGASYDVLDVAGSFELPQAIRLALGCIVRGGTDHYDHICRETMAGLMQVALDHGICLGSGVLTVHMIEQAVARSGKDGFNKGAEAAVAALLQINAARRFGVAV
jgi:6,7-dimethyl-8-ribityllumazine synthase